MKEYKKYTAIRQLTENPFLNLYEMDALTYSGKPFHYYFASRNQLENIKIHTRSAQAEGMLIYAILKEQPDTLVMIRQYRYPLDTYLYELPAGLIEPGESAGEAAIREMKEETGYHFEVYTGGNQSLRKPFYMGPGLTDESNQTVFGYASGNSSRHYQEDTENIQVKLVNKQEAKRILAEEKLSIRCAYLLLSFIHAKKETPFCFLDM